MVTDHQKKWVQEKDLMVKAADKLGKMLACSSQEEAAQLWEQYEKDNASNAKKHVPDD